MTSHSGTSDDPAAAAARDFGRSVAASWQARLGDGMLGVYLIGSLAHGGFNRRYSDIDMALIAAETLLPAMLEALRADAMAVSVDLTAKLSVFWSNRAFDVGRFPPLDRLDYLDHAVTLLERERVTPPRPPLTEVRAYLSGEPFERWSADAGRFAQAKTLEPKDYKAYLRTLLYPARFVYSGTTGCMGSNDAAVAFLADHPSPGLDVDQVTRALDCRRAAADPDGLFPLRSGLSRQVAACRQLIGSWAVERDSA